MCVLESEKCDFTCVKPHNVRFLEKLIHTLSFLRRCLYVSAQFVHIAQSESIISLGLRYLEIY